MNSLAVLFSQEKKREKLFQIKGIECVSNPRQRGCLKAGESL